MLAGWDQTPLWGVCSGSKEAAVTASPTGRHKMRQPTQGLLVSQKPSVCMVLTQQVSMPPSQLQHLIVWAPLSNGSLLLTSESLCQLKLYVAVLQFLNSFCYARFQFWTIKNGTLAPLSSRFWSNKPWWVGSKRRNKLKNPRGLILIIGYG